jgi:phosphatidylglycerophosphatase A
MLPSSPRWSDPAVIAATCLWLGRIPWAPGTWGAAVGIPLSLGIDRLAAGMAGGSPAVQLGCEAMLVLAVCLLGIPICTRAAAAIGGGSDPGAINLDEAASMPLAMLAVEPEIRGPITLLAAFLLFRLFDIAKPFPCRLLERLPAGLGVMADDWGAAVWTGCCLGLASLAGWLPAITV